MNDLFKVIDVLAVEPAKKPERAKRTKEIPEDPELVKELLGMFNRWHSHKEIWDDAIDIRIANDNVAIKTTHRKKLAWGPKGTKYLSPSSANSDKRELYLKLTGAQRDVQKDRAYRGRWRRIGTAFGDMLQRDLLFIEKHYEKEFGEKPPFVPHYIEIGDRLFPAWEDFAQTIVWVEHRGHRIPILGKPDGIIRRRETGELIGLEIKSKQTTYAQTSYHSMQEAKIDHVKQCVNYSIMYGVRDFVILYGNLSKKSWGMSEEDEKKYPDLRGFHIQVTDDMIHEMLDYYADVMDAVKTGVPPEMDIDKWMFNNFKTAMAHSLTDEEYTELKERLVRIMRSNMPDHKKRDYQAMFDFITEVRGS